MTMDVLVDSIKEDVLNRNGYSFIRKIDNYQDKFMVVDNLGKIRTILNRGELIEFISSLK